MKVLIALDKFKGSLTAQEACDVVAERLGREHPDWQLEICPLADGGEGFSQILADAFGANTHIHTVTGPLGTPLEARWHEVDLSKVPPEACDLVHQRNTGRMAIIEMAEASGLLQVPPSQRDPYRTTSRGTGELIVHAADAGVDIIVLGVGGSATNDLGVGAMAALGVDFLDSSKVAMTQTHPLVWPEIQSMQGRVIDHLPEIYIACDVTNPLLGKNGATAVYGPQKGLQREAFVDLETKVAHMAQKICNHFKKPVAAVHVPRAGAAGGIVFGLRMSCAAKTIDGFKLVSACLDLDHKIEAADIVITGEGRFDASSLQGKGPGALVKKADALGKQVHIFAGQVDPDVQTVLQQDYSQSHSHAITPKGYPMDQAQKEAKKLLSEALGWL